MHQEVIPEILESLKRQVDNLQDKVDRIPKEVVPIRIYKFDNLKALERILITEYNVGYELLHIGDDVHDKEEYSGYVVLEYVG